MGVRVSFSSQSLKLFAEIAQLVEHNLAKVRVASSSLVFRSCFFEVMELSFAQVADGGLSATKSADRLTKADKVINTEVLLMD